MHRILRSLILLIALGVLTGCGASQTYWYCWDEGAPRPHHLGYPVEGDHYCSEAELEEAGFE